MPAGLPLTQCPPACLWLKLAGLPLTQARRIAADSSSPDCRWLKLAGLPLTQARRIAADSCPLVVVGRESQLAPHFTPPSAAHRPRRSREITPPSVGKANPPSAAASSVAGKANPPSAVHSARSRLWLPPAAGPCRCVVKPAGCCRYLSSQPVMVSPAGRCRIDKPAGRGRIWPDSDLGLFKYCLCVFSPGGLLVPLSCPMVIFWGGTKVPAVVAGRGTRPRPPWTTGLGLLSSLLHLGLRLFVPLWRPRPVYVSVSVLRGLQSAHPPSPVELLRLGSSLPGGGSYVRDLSCASCGSRLLFLIFGLFLSVVIIVYSCHLLC